MKANHPLPRMAVLALAGPLLALLGSCTAAVPVAPKPAPTPVPIARPSMPAPLRPAINWRDAALTPGEWRWAMEGRNSVARFGTNASATQATLSCDRASGQVLLARTGTASSHLPVSVSTTTGSRPLVSEPALSQNGWIVVPLRPHDSVLDAIAFSRGRFALDTAGLPTLIMPVWPELSRVIEDCR